MTAAELIAHLEDMPEDAEVLFQVHMHIGPRDNGDEMTSHFHVYEVELDDDGDVILTTG